MSMKSFLTEPLSEAVVTTTTMDANLNHCSATGKSITGCLHFEYKDMDLLMAPSYFVCMVHTLHSILQEDVCESSVNLIFL